VRFGPDANGVKSEADDGEPDDDGPGRHPPEEVGDALGATPCRVQRRLRTAATGQQQRARGHDPPAGVATAAKPGDVARHARGEVSGVGLGIGGAMCPRRESLHSLPPIYLIIMTNPR
jgi:hypothetical protein